MFGQKSCGQSGSHCFSKWQRNALVKVGPSRDSMATTSNLLYEKFLKIFYDKIVNCIIIRKKVVYTVFNGFI